jgi:putative membrane-bound dehydrogenase-like protein
MDWDLGCAIIPWRLMWYRFHTKGQPMRSGSVSRFSRSLAIVAGCALAFWGTTSIPGFRGSEGAPPRAAAQAQSSASSAATGAPIRVLFLGQDQPTHSAAALYPALAPVLARRGIQLTPALTPDDALTPEKLGYYDALLIYGNHTAITPAQEKALLDFVEGGKGVVAIHSASEMFTGSEKYAALIGAQSKREGGAEFTAQIVQPAHPAMQGVQPFAAWDESVTYTKQNPAGRTVLMERADAGGKTPWTWVRTQGKGRVFYTAYGHDQRTWTNPGFQTLIEKGIAWSVPEPTRVAWQQFKVPQVAMTDGAVAVPNYERRDPAPKYQLPFTVEESMKFIQVPAEFKIELFAAEPDIVKPIAFTFDEKGRMWIAETIDYPNTPRAGKPGQDRIRILEDTNGDGRADKFTTFAENLNIPTSIAFARGGLIVSMPPDILFLKDTNGDDKADVREVVSTGWRFNDTHATLSNLQYGMDNSIWGVVGYSGFEGEINGKKLQFGQAAFRFKPDGRDFEVVTGSTNNTWGLGFTETFDVFGSTANNDPSWYMAIPNRLFEGVEGLPVHGQRGVGPGYQSVAAFYPVHPLTPYIRQVDVFGGYTAGAGHHFYTARAFPKSYWNRVAFINEPTAHLTGQGVIEKKGAGFVTRDGWNLVAGAEEWFAPVQAQVGPDGAVWIADWYNFIIQHNPTPQGFANGPGNAYESPLRDHQRGRIYRISYKGAPAYTKRSLSLNDTKGLLDALASDNMFWRLTAQRMLVDRGQKDVVPQLIALTRNTSVDAIGINGGAMHALWTLKGLGELDSTSTQAYQAAVAALKHPAGGVRKAAAMVLPKTAEAAGAMLKANSLQDADLQTRLAATLVLAEMPESNEIGQALYRESAKPENFSDGWLARAFYIAATRHKTSFLTTYKSDKNAVPFDALPVALRLGTLKPDWRSPTAKDIAADWKDMDAPGNWEARGLPDFDGVVWFTKTVNLTSLAGIPALSLGPIRAQAEIWVNGLALNLPGGGRGGAGGGGKGVELPPGALKQGANQITVRIQNPRQDGGFVGTPEQMFVQLGEQKTSLAGTWKYRVERQTNVGALYAKPGELAAHLAFTAGGGMAGEAGKSLKPVAPPAPDVTIRIAAVPGQLKYDLNELTVAPGQLVEIVFTNPDAMQHNFVLGAANSLEAIGTAADKLATTPAGLQQGYVPDMPQVIFSTRLVEPNETASFQFKAPTDPGKYPYLCTFPAHWRVMNGVLNVVQPQGRGGRGAQ